MKVQTTNGIVVVTSSQLTWLGATGKIRDMTNFPQALPCYDGSSAELQELLETMPAGWSPPTRDPLKTVDPEDPEGSLVIGPIPGPVPGPIPGPVPGPDEGDETTRLLRSINEGVHRIVRFIDHIHPQSH